MSLVKNLPARIRRSVDLRSVVEVVTTRDASSLGRWLMLFCALVIAVTGWYVDDRHPDRVDLWVPIVTGSMLLIAGPTGWLRWHRLPRRAVLLYPMSGLALLGFAGYLAPSAGPSYVSMFTLWFLFIGVTQKAGTAWMVAPFAGVMWVVLSWPIDEQKLVRLGLAMLVWMLLAEILAMRTQRADARTEDLNYQADTDPLTGLANRRTLQRELDTTRDGDVLVMLDLDHFKRVNDTRGHDGGDLVLIDFAATLNSVVRSGDIAARFGGEEFALLLRRPNRTSAHVSAVTTDMHDAAPVLARLRNSWQLQHPGITWSAGVCVHATGITVPQTLSCADTALYEAKRGGRDRVVVHGTSAPASEPLLVG